MVFLLSVVLAVAKRIFSEISNESLLLFDKKNINNSVYQLIIRVYFMD